MTTRGKPTRGNIREEDRGVIDRYVEWLRQDHTAIAESIRREILRETPGYRSLSGEGEIALASRIDLALEMFIDAALHGRGLTAAERITMQAIGRAMADAGIPLDAITAGVNVAARVVRDWPTLHESVEKEEAERFRLFSERTTTFANGINAAILSAYVSRTEERATSQEQARARFWNRLLGGGYDSDDVAVRQGLRAGCDLDHPWALVLLPGHRRLERLEVDALASVPGAVSVPVVNPTVPHVVLAVPVPACDVWTAIEATMRVIGSEYKAVLVSVGPCGSPTELHRCYQRTVPLVAHINGFAGSPGLLRATDLADAAVLATVPESAADDFASQTLGAIERRPRQQARRWLRTLDALVHNDGSPKAAAAALGVNPKTVRRRMEGMKNEVGLAFDSFDTLYRVRMALTLRKLSPGRDIFGSKVSNQGPLGVPLTDVGDAVKGPPM